jgi:hypothetical protein
MISTTAVSVLTRADSKFKSNESMKGKVLSDAYLEFIIVNKVSVTSIGRSFASGA